MLLLLLLLLPLLPATNSDNGTILEIDKLNFNKQSHAHPNFLLMFYSPQCRFCRKFEPEYEAAAHLLAPHSSHSQLGRTNCLGNGDQLCLQFAVSCLPTIKLFKDGEFVKDYQLSRTARDVARFMRAQVEPASRNIGSIEEFRKFLEEQWEAVLVGFFEEGAKTKKVFFKLTEELKEKMVFAHSTCDALLKRQRVYDGVVLFRPIRFENRYEETKLLYTGHPIFGQIKTFIISNYHGLVGHRTPQNRYTFTHPLLVLYYRVRSSHHLRERHYWRLRLLRLAHKYSSLVTFSVSSRDEFFHELTEVGVACELGSAPVVVIKGLDSSCYRLPSTPHFSTEAVDNFVHDFLAGNLTPVAKRAVFKVWGAQGGVVEGVDDNFDEVVFDNGRDTLVHFYSNSDLQSKKFYPVFEEVGERLKEEEVALVRVDAERNEVPDLFEVNRFPILYWLPRKRRKGVVRYEGLLTVEGVVRFVAERATEELVKFDRSGKLREEKTEL